MISNPKTTMENYKKVSFEILEEQQSEDFLELQNKFDKLVLSLRNELNAISQIMVEMKEKRENFIKKESIKTDVSTIDEDLKMFVQKEKELKDSFFFEMRFK
ncbi:MAG: hypothetical protein AB7U51_12535 [Arcobacter sp.]|uniref:hypothetical protein n=1 Tax=Arcobacter sp. TaxID=1872629 RepID=UPI003D05E4AF